MSRNRIALTVCIGMNFAVSIAPAAADELLDRPLFSPTRRAPHPANAGLPVDAIPVLTGIVDAPGSIRAVFKTTDGSQPMPQTVGSRIDGWTLTGLDPHEAVLEKDGRRMTLRPPFVPSTNPSSPP